MDGEPPGNIKKEFFERFVFLHTPDPSEEGRWRWRVGCTQWFLMGYIDCVSPPILKGVGGMKKQNTFQGTKQNNQNKNN
jgi:hypothetical protein